MAKQGEQAFDEYFSEVYPERWPAIKAALYNDDCKVARKNLFHPEQNGIEERTKGVGAPHPELKHCFEVSEEFDLAQIDSPILPFYRMDPASVMAARALDVQPGDRVLDMCAAPGGKTLVLLEDLFIDAQDNVGELVANELSPKRRHRLMSVIKRYVTKEWRGHIHIRGVDGGKIGLREKDAFDRILLDAPCSGERGVVQKASELAQWKVKRTKSFGIRQYALLSSAFMALKPGGRIVYSTCSISPQENDDVIAKLIKRKGEEVEVVEIDAPKMSEKTTYGYQFLPDQSGWGPIFFSIVEKKRQ